MRLDPTARTFDLSLRLPVDLTAFARPTLIHIPIPAHQIASLSATHLPTRTAPPAVHNTFVQRRAQRPSAAAKNRRDGDADEDDDDGDDDNDDEPTITRLALTLSSPLAPIGPSPRACGGSPPPPRDRRARAALAALHSLLLCNNNNPPLNAAATSDEGETTTTTTDDDEDNNGDADDSPPSPTNANALTLYLPTTPTTTNRPFTSSSLALPLHHLPTAITEQWPPRQPQPRQDLRRMYGGRGGAVLGLDVLEVEARLEGQRRAFEERLEAQGKLFQATLDAVEARWSERYEAWEAHMEGRIDDHFDGVRFDTDRAIEGADARWDDEIHLVKNELRDFVREEVGQAEENIKDHLRSGGANVTIEFV
ncbi:hypothetical protein UCDDS831_g04166 [Diplodia seriata]|uniref:Uncharacterized protein n=1 Tax=Diplodia seriata TaxID=420778 RepID=A0A0G2EHE2_9PEZI|nr:hypothetical protein UCDDS831_g04166 [Diplodia seriata]